jgi:hypothetical protein
LCIPPDDDDALLDLDEDASEDDALLRVQHDTCCLPPRIHSTPRASTNGSLARQRFSTHLERLDGTGGSADLYTHAGMALSGGGGGTRSRTENSPSIHTAGCLVPLSRDGSQDLRNVSSVGSVNEIFDDPALLDASFGSRPGTTAAQKRCRWISDVAVVVTDGMYRPCVHGKVTIPPTLNAAVGNHGGNWRDPLGYAGRPAGVGKVPNGLASVFGPLRSEDPDLRVSKIVGSDPQHDPDPNGIYE